MPTLDIHPMTEVRRRYDYNKLRLLRHYCLQGYMRFVRVFFRERTSQRFIENWHHRVMCDTLDRVAKGEIQRLIINCPPGFSKTELAAVLFFAYLLALNPRAKNMHLSYSGDLAWDNSKKVKRVVESALYQAFFPGTPRITDRAARHWRTENNGSIMAAPTGGQVTGFRAGRLEDGMQGAMSVDDPVKPEDAVSLRVRTKVNARWGNTVRSRVARIETPMVVIMQRLHEDDLTGFLLKGGSGEKWHHLIIPAEVTESSKEYLDEYTHGIPVEYLAPLGYTWPLKVSGDFATALKADPVLWSTQYQQEPTVDTGEIFHSDWWEFYEFFDPVNSQVVFDDGTRVLVRYKAIYADTAMKTSEQHDWSVFELFAKLEDQRIALLELERGKWESYELQDQFVAFCERFRYQPKINNMGVRSYKVEDKASGTGLIQAVNNSTSFRVEGIPRDKDKVSRAKSCAPQIALGKVLLPRSAAWLGEYLREFHKFNSGMTHKHDDQIDPTMDAIEDMIIRDGWSSYGEVL